jgi:hypothetical protein
VFARSWVKVLRLVESRRNPHRSGEVFARGLTMVRSTRQLPEKPPPEWEGVCEPIYLQSARVVEKPPPKRGGVCEPRAARLARLAGCEKPPPRWGGVCEHSSKTCKHCWRNPHRSGEVFARLPLIDGRITPQSEKPPPKWGGVCEWLDRCIESGI